MVNEMPIFYEYTIRACDNVTDFVTPSIHKELAITSCSRPKRPKYLFFFRCYGIECQLSASVAVVILLNWQSKVTRLVPDIIELESEITPQYRQFSDLINKIKYRHHA